MSRRALGGADVVPLRESLRGQLLRALARLYLGPRPRGGASPGWSDRRDACGRREDAGASVLPADADNRGRFAEHLLDYSSTARL
jgi:hypothetical protein